MYQQFYTNNPYVDFALVAFLIFMGVFSLIIAYTFISARSSDSFKFVESLPLEDKAHD